MSFTSMEMQDQGVSIPYHQGLSLGNAVDFTQPFGGNDFSRKGADIKPTRSQVDLLSCQFSLPTSFSDVCQVLDIPPQYALKVASGNIQNDVVSTCLQDIYSKQTFKLIIRLRFIKEVHHYIDSLQSITVLESGESTGFDAQSSKHVVEAVCVGEELVIVIGINAPTKEMMTIFRDKIKQTFGNESGVLKEDQITIILSEVVKSLETKMAKSHYSQVNYDIQYGVCTVDDGNTQSPLAYPNCLSGMVDAVIRFVNKWHRDKTDAVEFQNIVSSQMKVIKGIESASIGNPDTLPKLLFKLRVTLQPPVTESSHDSLGDDMQVYESVHSSVYIVNKTLASIEGFLREHDLFGNSNHIREANEIKLTVANQSQSLCDLLNDKMGLTTSLTSEDVDYARLLAANLPELVESFIQKVTTKLPKGGDVNLLIIGKTGHGKSSTANSILRRQEFKASSGSISETKSCQTAWTETDGRIFKVVDVPGVCDTDLDSVDSAKLAMRCISEAISSCSSGFHALLLVIRYGNKMTAEEERAIYILKCILGSAIISTHCICVVTHGDIFEEGEGNFQDWCKKQEGFLKTVFEECNYRCVLFNNKTNDPAVMKTQLINLTTMIDNLESRGTCYTNEIFKHAERDRERLLQELQLPQFKEEIFKDLDLIQSAFLDAQNAEESQKNVELDKLKSRCDELVAKLDEIKCSGISELYLAVSNMSEQITLQKEKNLADAKLQAQQQAFMLEQEKLRADAQALASKLAQETAEKIKQEEANKRIIEERERNYVRKKSRWVTFRDSIFK